VRLDALGVDVAADERGERRVRRWRLQRVQATVAEIADARGEAETGVRLSLDPYRTLSLCMHDADISATVTLRSARPLPYRRSSVRREKNCFPILPHG